jgi:hypothetical protein
MLLDELSFATLRPKSALQSFAEALLRTKIVSSAWSTLFLKAFIFLNF